MSAIDNLLQGPASIFVAAVGTSLPSVDDIADLEAGTLSGWSAVGETTAATMLKDSPQYVRANSQQRTRALDVFVSEVTTTIETTAREVTAARMRDMVRGTSETTEGVTTVTPGGIGPVPKFSVCLLGGWPGGSALVVVERAAFVDGQEMAWDTSKVTEVPLKVEVLTGDELGDAGYAIYLTNDDALGS